VSGVAWTLPTFARALVTPMSTSFSCCAKPCTVATRFGMRSARRLYWFSTSAHAAFTCSSLVWKSLYPQPDRVSAASAATAQSSFLIFCSPWLPAGAGAMDVGARAPLSSGRGKRAACEHQVFPGLRLLREAAQQVGGVVGHHHGNVAIPMHPAAQAGEARIGAEQPRRGALAQS